jgi:hypothetical protein
MAFCEGCGDFLDAAAHVCPKCGRDSGAATDGNGAATGFLAASIMPPVGLQTDSGLGALTQSSRPSLPGTNVVLAMGETMWRSYEVTQLRSPRQGHGRLFVTSSRLIFHAQANRRGRPSLLVLETQIGSITGIRTYVTKRVSRILMFLGILLAIGGLVSLVSGTATGVLFLLIGAAMIGYALSRFGRMGTVTIQVYSQQTSMSPVSFGNAWADRGGGIVRSFIRGISGPVGILTSLFGAQDAFDFQLGFPGPDAIQAASELGAMVIDLQSKGTLAEAHWNVLTG